MVALHMLLLLAPLAFPMTVEDAASVGVANPSKPLATVVPNAAKIISDASMQNGPKIAADQKPPTVPVKDDKSGSTNTEDGISELNITHERANNLLAVAHEPTARGFIKLITIKGRSQCTLVTSKLGPIWKTEKGERARRVLWVSASGEQGALQIITSADKAIAYLYFSESDGHFAPCPFKMFSETFYNQLEHKRVNIRSNDDPSSEMKQEYWKNTNSDIVKPQLNCMHIKVAIDGQEVWTYEQGGELCLQVARDIIEGEMTYLLVTLRPPGTVIERYRKIDGKWTKCERVFKTGDNISSSQALPLAVEVPGLDSPKDIVKKTQGDADKAATAAALKDTTGAVTVEAASDNDERQGVADESADAKRPERAKLIQQPPLTAADMGENSDLKVIEAEDEECREEEVPKASGKAKDNDEDIPVLTMDHGEDFRKKLEKDTVASLLNMGSTFTDEREHTRHPWEIPTLHTQPPYTGGRTTAKPSVPNTASTSHKPQGDPKVNRPAKPATTKPVKPPPKKQTEGAGKVDNRAAPPVNNSPDPKVETGRVDDKAAGGETGDQIHGVDRRKQRAEVGVSIGIEEEEDEDEAEDAEATTPRDDVPGPSTQIGKETGKGKEEETVSGNPGSNPTATSPTSTDDDVIPKVGRTGRNPRDSDPVDEPGATPRAPKGMPVIRVPQPGSDTRHSLRGQNTQGDEPSGTDRGSQGQQGRGVPNGRANGNVPTGTGAGPSPRSANPGGVNPGTSSNPGGGNLGSGNPGSNDPNPGKEENDPSEKKTNFMFKAESSAIYIAIAFMTMCALVP